MIDLSHRSIETLKDIQINSSFSEMSKNNTINYITYDRNSTQYSQSTLSVDHNKTADSITIPYDWHNITKTYDKFRNIKPLLGLNLSHNAIHTLDHLDILLKTFLTTNNQLLQTIDSDAFVNQTQKHYTNNLNRSIHFWIDFSYNNIKRVPNHINTGTSSNIRYINFAQTMPPHKIVQSHDNSHKMNQLSFMAGIYFRGNPIICDCENDWGHWFQRTKFHYLINTGNKTVDNSNMSVIIQLKLLDEPDVYCLDASKTTVEYQLMVEQPSDKSTKMQTMITSRRNATQSDELIWEDRANQRKTADWQASLRAVKREQLIPLSGAHFLCPYEEYCAPLCQCCTFFYCDCKYVCPPGCICFRDAFWAHTVLRCGPRYIPPPLNTNDSLVGEGWQNITKSYESKQKEHSGQYPKESFNSTPAKQETTQPQIFNRIVRPEKRVFNKSENSENHNIVEKVTDIGIKIDKLTTAESKNNNTLKSSETTFTSHLSKSTLFSQHLTAPVSQNSQKMDKVVWSMEGMPPEFYKVPENLPRFTNELWWDGVDINALYIDGISQKHSSDLYNYNNNNTTISDISVSNKSTPVVIHKNDNTTNNDNHVFIRNERPLIRLRNYAFFPLSYLKHLYLNGSGISTIEPKALSRLISLQTLDLSCNQLTQLPDFMFIKTEHIKSLNLSHNQITELRSTVFSRSNVLQSITHFDVSYNAMTHLDARILKNMMDKTPSDTDEPLKLYLAGNRFNCTDICFWHYLFRINEKSLSKLNIKNNDLFSDLTCIYRGAKRESSLLLKAPTSDFLLLQAFHSTIFPQTLIVLNSESKILKYNLIDLKNEIFSPLPVQNSKNIREIVKAGLETIDKMCQTKYSHNTNTNNDITSISSEYIDRYSIDLFHNDPPIKSNSKDSNIKFIRNNETTTLFQSNNLTSIANNIPKNELNKTVDVTIMNFDKTTEPLPFANETEFDIINMSLSSNNNVTNFNQNDGHLPFLKPIIVGTSMAFAAVFVLFAILAFWISKRRKKNKSNKNNPKKINNTTPHKNGIKKLLKSRYPLLSQINVHSRPLSDVVYSTDGSSSAASTHSNTYDSIEGAMADDRINETFFKTSDNQHLVSCLDSTCEEAYSLFTYDVFVSYDGSPDQQSFIHKTLCPILTKTAADNNNGLLEHKFTDNSSKHSKGIRSNPLHICNSYSRDMFLSEIIMEDVRGSRKILFVISADSWVELNQLAGKNYPEFPNQSDKNFTCEYPRQDIKEILDLFAITWAQDKCVPKSLFNSANRVIIIIWSPIKTTSISNSPLKLENRKRTTYSLYNNNIIDIVNRDNDYKNNFGNINYGSSTLKNIDCVSTYSQLADIFIIHPCLHWCEDLFWEKLHLLIGTSYYLNSLNYNKNVK